ncbi:MAG: hypothetical protein ACYC1K_00900 [Minisyncoccota bacterium]
MNKWKYWQQEAATWVSASVLIGGLLSAVILFFLQRVEANSDFIALPISVDQLR